MKRIIYILMAAAVALAPADSFARRQKQRNAKSVKQEQRATAKAIEKTKSDITQNDKETRRQLNRLNSLTAEIDSRSRDIASLEERLAAIDRRLAAVCDVVAEVAAGNPKLYKGALPL